jgi:leucyl aminopeptidase
MQIKVTDNFDSKTIIIPIFENETLPEKLKNIALYYDINEDFVANDFKAEAGESLLTYFKLGRIYLLGLGKKTDSMSLLKIFRSFFNKKSKELSANTALNLSNLEIDYEAVINGIVLGGYDLKLYKTDKSAHLNFFTNPATQLEILVEEQKTESLKRAVKTATAIAESQMQVMDLGNKPANKKPPQALAAWAVASGQKYGYEVTVFDEKQCEALGLKALLSVSKGSEYPPRFIVMEYRHEAATQKIGLVGKGVTFDTGGISIKDSANMHYMKSDMGGAAAVFGTIEAAAKLQLPVHLIGIVPTTENSVDGLATKPGDVIGSYMGKTIEVIDTDAEGRLILADGLAYLNRNYKPNVIIDLATLTGSVIGTLGYAAAGMFTNNDQLGSSLKKIGDKTGEKLWRLPLWDDYEPELKSDIADIKNYHGKPFAGAIVAAKFLEVFTEKHPAWVHLDIAGTAFADSEFATQKSATAFGVRLLVQWLREL